MRKLYLFICFTVFCATANAQSYSFFNEYDFSDSEVAYKCRQFGDSSIFVKAYANYNDFIFKIDAAGNYINHLFPGGSISSGIHDIRFESNYIRIICTVTDGPYFGMPGHYKLVTTDYNLQVISQINLLDSVNGVSISSAALNSIGPVVYHTTSLPRLTQWDHSGNLRWTFIDSTTLSWNGRDIQEGPNGGVKVIAWPDNQPYLKVYELDSLGNLLSMYNWLSPYTSYKYSNGNLYSIDQIADTINPGELITEFAQLDPITYSPIASGSVHETAWDIEYNVTNNLTYAICITDNNVPWSSQDIRIVAFDANFNEAYSHSFPATLTHNYYLRSLFINDNGEILATGEVWKYDTTGYYINQQYLQSTLNSVVIKMNSDLSIIGMTSNYIPPAVKVFPNPILFSGIINFDIDPSISTLPNLSYTISNSNGITQSSGPLINDPFDLDISNWESGMYFIFIYSNGTLVGHSQFMKI